MSRRALPGVTVHRCGYACPWRFPFRTCETAPPSSAAVRQPGTRKRGVHEHGSAPRLHPPASVDSARFFGIVFFDSARFLDSSRFFDSVRFADFVRFLGSVRFADFVRFLGSVPFADSVRPGGPGRSHASVQSSYVSARPGDPTSPGAASDVGRVVRAGRDRLSGRARVARRSRRVG
ncbi:MULTISPECIES: hypothetical protein [unclassified Streptomyces]|uniref:hypothetical protein n=1 Tax=unclassified Streptomyces TaxID=2593676 RepID=UPI002E81ABCF|nr:hypothetical protein [Streptomyces sp. NBC_00589]WTI40582.1 hypothetical protein OIC96_39090 [Streptomyces sp. NBC_00775]WUB25734.1 hypothetical protein OHA51_10640 [Streptomyces sp. NBC_00589]